MLRHGIELIIKDSSEYCTIQTENCIDKNRIYTNFLFQYFFTYNYFFFFILALPMFYLCRSSSILTHQCQKVSLININQNNDLGIYEANKMKYL